MNEDSGDFSDGLDEFEESADEGQAKKKVKWFPILPLTLTASILTSGD